MAEVLLYHPKTHDTTVAPNEEVAEVLKKSGWTTEVPKSRQDDNKKEA